MSEPFLAEIKMFGGNFAPRGWAFCDGQILAISSYSALFSLLGTTYGGDGRTTFGLPDLRGRFALHPGTGPGLPTVRWGEKSGQYQSQLTQTNLPSHTHAVDNQLKVGVQTGTQNSDDPDGAVLAAGPNIYNDSAADATMGAGSIAGTLTIGNTGGGQPFTNMPPFTGIHYIIALVGVYPSRNFMGK